jgi:hypothetical protein
LIKSAIALAVSYTFIVGGTVSSSPDGPPLGLRRTILNTNVMTRPGRPIAAHAEVMQAFGHFSYDLWGGPVGSACNAAGRSCPLSWAQPLTVALPPTRELGNSITFENPLITRLNPLDTIASRTFAGFGTFTTSTGKTGSLSFTVHPADTWGGTLDLNLVLGIPGPVPAAGVVAGLGLARHLRRRLTRSR